MNRQERRQKERQEKKGDSHFPHVKVGHKPPGGARVPTTKREMQMHLSGKHTDEFRDPLTRRERRAWDRFWSLKGKGFTKAGTKRKED